MYRRRRGGAERDCRTCVVRIKVEEIIGLRAHKVIRGRRTPASDADRLGERVECLEESSLTCVSRAVNPRCLL